MTAYYSENNLELADWLRALIKRGLIAPGDVDDRSIAQVRACDLKGYTQCHFFAGIGGWSYALRLANWPDERPCWTASVPCQPWSRARIHAQQTAQHLDVRDLWPVFFPLVKQLNPIVLYGEQVLGKAMKPWVSRLRIDMRAINYQLFIEEEEAWHHGSAQKRPRLFFSADSMRERRRRLEPSKNPSTTRLWRWDSKTDLRAIADAPFEPGDRWPQPLLRSSDARIPGRMGIVRGFGNSIDPHVAADFIKASTETEKRKRGFF